jgi:type III secretion protein C
MKNYISLRKTLKINRLSLLFCSAILTQSLLVEALDIKEGNVDQGFSLNSYHSPGGLLFPIDHPIDNNVADNTPSAPKAAAQKLIAQQLPQQTLHHLQETGNQNQNIVPEEAPKSLYINFNNIGMIEYLRFLSRTLNKNFTFDEADLQFNVTIISDEPMTFENIMTALMQELWIHGLSLLEQGNSIIIHKNNKVNAISQLVSDDPLSNKPRSEIVTQVFKLNTADPDKVAAVVKPLTSEFALVEVLAGTNHLIITDLSANVAQIAKLIKTVDAPNSGLVIGQYVVKTTSAATLIDMAQQIIGPISQDQPLKMVPWPASNSIFIVSTPYIVERTLSILQHIDQNQKSTRIFDLQEMKFKQGNKELPPPKLKIGGEKFEPEEGPPAPPPAPKIGPPPGPAEDWELDENGHWKLKVPQNTGPTPPEGYWLINKLGNWSFNIGTPPKEIPLSELQNAPKGQWLFDSTGGWNYQLEEGESIHVRRLSRPEQPSVQIPYGVRPRKQFSVYKLQYRKGEAIQKSLQSISSSLLTSPDVDSDLIDTLTSVQYLETSNSLIFTGYRDNLIQMSQLMHEIDTPLRQVFIEMLVLETTLDDALEYSVTWGTRFAGDHWAGGEGFGQTGGTNLISPLNNTLNGAALTGINATVANNLFATQGLNLGVVGQKVVNTALGIEFNSIGALVQSLRLKNNTNVVLNPKILTEDSVPAEIFVGENIPFKTQSISNDQGNNITSNFQFRDVGTRFRVTPTLGNGDIITLEIAQEISAILPTSSSGGNINNAPEGPSTTKSTTTTRVHLPSGYFLIISGMMRDECDQAAIQVPCLGAIPIIGAAFKDKAYAKSKRNQMIFIRPIIIQTEEEIQNLTKHQQDIWQFKKEFPMKKDWVYESELGLDFLNLRRTPVIDTNPFRPDDDF